MDELFEKMKKLIADRLEIEEAKITLDSSSARTSGPTAWTPTSWCTQSRKSWESASPTRRPTSSRPCATRWNTSARRSRNRAYLFKRTRRTAAVLRPERKKELQLFEKHAGIRFRELESLNQAFTHRSFAHESGESTENNERLEFLGDSVLGMVVSEYLYQALTEQAEGELARIKSFVVSEASLSEIAKRLRVDNFILIGKGEEYSGGRTKKAILADALEAIIGAYYLDSGFQPARKFVRQLLIPEVTKVLEDRHAKDYKTLLQEYVQRRLKTYPHYRVVQKTGPDHDRTFWIEVHIGERSYGAGKGKNKKEAEQDAARLAYEGLHAADKPAPGRQPRDLSRDQPQQRDPSDRPVRQGPRRFGQRERRNQRPEPPAE
jgi:ribonuclease III